MTTATIVETTTPSSELIKTTAEGETVIVTSDWKGASASDAALSAVPQRLGFLEHLHIDIPDSFFFDPLPEEELRLWEGDDDSE